MKKKFLGYVTIVLFNFPVICFGQSVIQNEIKPKTLENGVVVHAAVGVEGVVSETTETPKQENSLEYWTEDQIRETIEYINLKKAENCSVKEYNSYEEQLKMLEERLKQLIEKK